MTKKIKEKNVRQKANLIICETITILRQRVIPALIGLGALVWFLIRVIPKPERAAYPCQRAAFPLATSFVLWLTGSLASVLAFKKAKKQFAKSKLFIAGIYFLAGIGLAVVFLGDYSAEIFAKDVKVVEHPSNQPIGQAKGIFPGRVVWAWNPDAVNENTPNTWKEDDNWWMNKNTSPTAVNQMLRQAVMNLSGQSELFNAWDAIFRYYNESKGNSGKSYQKDEKIAIKVNFVSCDGGNMDGHDKTVNLNMIDCAPQLMWAVLNQLVNGYGVSQENICMGDPSSYFPNQYYDLLKGDFPEVVYLSLENTTGRTKIQATGQNVIHFSDGSGGDDIPQQFVAADYMINISVLKHHTSAGFSQIAKNHYGSNTQNTASHMHYSLVNEQSGMGHYRHLVDWLGHEHLGGKTILNIGDFLWSGEKAWTSPVKFDVAPFNNDYPSSILVSQDPVAIESVGLDFIQSQSWDDNLASAQGVDDFLHQAADPDNWPENIDYDPENDGTVIQSLGVHEHWNNDNDKEYSRNLGSDEGIELVKIFLTGTNQNELKAPTNLKLNYSEELDKVNISWTDNAGDETGFIVEKSLNNGDNYQNVQELSANATSFIDESPGQAYQIIYRIKAYTETDTSQALAGTVIVDNATTVNITGEDVQNTISIYPNPANDFIHIPSTSKELENITIFDLSGKQHLTHNNPTSKIDISSLKAGWYIVQISTADKMFRKKLCVK